MPARGAWRRSLSCALTLALPLVGARPGSALACTAPFATVASAAPAAATEPGAPLASLSGLWLTRDPEPALNIGRSWDRCRDLSELARQLSPEERDTLVGFLRAQPPEPGTRGEFLQLALQDGDAWLRLLDRLASRGANDLVFTASLQPEVDRLPEAIRERLFARVRELYADPALRSKRDGDAFAPKRVLDDFILAALGGGNAYDRRRAGGATAFEAWAAHLDGIARLVLPGRPAASALDATETLDLARAIQRALRERGPERLRETLAERGRDPGSARVDELVYRIYGSVANGTLRPGSADLDVATAGRFGHYLYPLIEEAARDALAAAGKSLSLRVEAADAPIERIDPLGVLGPYMIEITTSEIRLVVYPSGLEKQTGLLMFSGDAGPVTFVQPAPAGPPRIETLERASPDGSVSGPTTVPAPGSAASPASGPALEGSAAPPALR